MAATVHPRSADTALMSRLFLFFAIVAGAWYALESAGISVDPRGVGTDVDGRQVVRDAGDVEAHFRARSRGCLGTAGQRKLDGFVPPRRGGDSHQC